MILAELTANARISMSALAEKVQLSRSHCYRRVEALERSGVIRSYTVDVDHAQAGLELAAVILVETVQERWAEVHELIRAMPGVQLAVATTGNFDVTLLVRVASLDHLRETILSRLSLVPGVRTTRTLVVLEEILSQPVALPLGRT